MEKSTNSSSTHINVESASTLNRRYVRRPSAYTNYENESASTAEQLAAEALRRRQALAEEMNRKNLENLRKARLAKKARQQAQPSIHKVSISAPEEQPAPIPPVAPVEKPVDRAQLAQASILAQAAKDRATDAALQTAALESVATSEMKEEQPQKSSKKSSKKTLKDSKSRSRFILAFAASAACIVTLGLVVKLNMPDLSVRVAAMQTGIEASYPSYLPSGYQLAGVSTGKNDTITMDFSGEDGKGFNLTEEKSSWDSNALLNNYVKETWGTDYVVVREQGITIYISSSDATWINGGILYKLTTPTADTLTKKEIKNIVTSL